MAAGAGGRAGPAWSSYAWAVSQPQPESGIPASAGVSDILEGRLLAPGAVAKLFGVDPRTVTRWVDKGMLAPIMTPGGHRRYRYLDVMALRDRLSGDAVRRPDQPAATPSMPPLRNEDVELLRPMSEPSAGGSVTHLGSHGTADSASSSRVPGQSFPLQQPPSE